MEKILVMGLPGSGKTYFAEKLKKYLETSVFYKPAETASASCPDVKWINGSATLYFTISTKESGTAYLGVK